MRTRKCSTPTSQPDGQSTVRSAFPYHGHLSPDVNSFCCLRYLRGPNDATEFDTNQVKQVRKNACLPMNLRRPVLSVKVKRAYPCRSPRRYIRWSSLPSDVEEVFRFPRILREIAMGRRSGDLPERASLATPKRALTLPILPNRSHFRHCE